MKKIIFILFIAHYSLQIAEAQQPTQEWIAKWPSISNPEPSNGKSIKQDSLGYIYVLADTGLGFGFLKYDQNGDLLYSAHHSPVGNWTAGGSIDMVVTKSGDVYITGPVYIELDMWIYTVKYSSLGILEWYRLYNRDENNSPEQIILDNNENPIVIGGANRNNIGIPLIIKYLPNGDTSWISYFGIGTTCISNQRACIDNYNNIYTTGGIGIPGKCLILKYNSEGSLIWYKTFTLDAGRTNYGWGGLALDHNRDLYIIGTQIRPQNIYDTYLLKLRNNGDTVWSRVYPDFGPGNYSLWGPIISTNNNEIYYTATYYAQNSGYDIGTLKYDSTGNLQWIKTFSAGLIGGVNIPSKIKFDRFENIYVCGGGDFTSTGHDFIILKYLPNGNLHWMTRYIGPVNGGRDFANDMIIDSNKILSTGNSRKTINSYNDAIIIKYDQILAMNSTEYGIPGSYKLYQNYPNPFNNSTVITYALPSKSFVQVEIYSITGQNIFTLVQSLQDAGTYSIIINLERFSSGIYFYKLNAGNKFSDTKKLIYIK